MIKHENKTSASIRFYWLCSKHPRLSASRGAQAVLSTVLLIGGVLVLIGLSIVFLSGSFLNSSQGYRLAQRAQTVAASGAQDALIQLTRDKDFENTTGYSVAVGSSTATVTVTQNSPVAGQAVITSTATVSSYKRTIRAVVSRNASTSQITVLSWMQI